MPAIRFKGVDYTTPTVYVQSDASATDLENTKVPTGQTIKSYLNSNFVYNVGDVITFTASDAPMLSGIITEAYQCVLGIPTGRKINASKYTINMNSAYIRTLSGLVQVTSGITMESVYQINKDTGNISLYLHFSSNVFASNLKNTPCIGMLIGKITFSN